MKLAFWNVRKRDALARQLAEHAAPDIIALAECAHPVTAEAELKAYDADWTLLPGTGDLITVFDRSGRLTPGDTLERGAVLKVDRAPEGPVLLFLVHLWSQTRIDVEKISLRIGRLRPVIVEHERRAGHRRSLVLGDFNLDPFSLGLSDRELLMGVMDLRQAERLARAPATRDPTFYNPMWSRLGDRTDGPPGTYHRSGDSHRDYFFHTFDQVLLRPELVPAFADLEIPRTLGPLALVSSNDIPRKAAASDHLPVIFTLS